MKYSDIFTKAQWIQSKNSSPCVCFRDTFIADTDKKTEITVCGLGLFRLYINGKKVGKEELAPVTSYYHDRKSLYCREKFGEELASRTYVKKYDISDYVRNGENTVGIMCGMGWYYEFSDRPVLTFEIVNGGVVCFSGEHSLCADGALKSVCFHKGEQQDYTDALYDENGFPESGYVSCEKAQIPETEYYFYTCPDDRIIRSLSVKKLSEKDGKTVYDIGENITGTVVFRCNAKGKKITVEVAEQTDGDTISEKYKQEQESVFVCDGSDREYRLLFTWTGFRYIRIDSDAQVLRVDEIHTDAPVISSFRSENAVLTWLYEAFVRTQLSNMHLGIPSDCPHLEKRGYTGDGELTCPAVMMTVDSEEFYLKWMRDISDCQDRKTGHVQYTAPYAHCGGGPGGWGCAIAVVPYCFWKHYGNIEPMKEYYGQALSYLDYLEQHSENELVVSDNPGLWCLGDWCTPHTEHAQYPEIPEPFVNNYFYIKTIDILLETATLTGNGDKIDFLRELRQRKVDAINRTYFDAQTGDYAQNLNSADAFALDIGLGDERTLENLLKHIRNDMPDVGIFGIRLVAEVLFSKGYYDDIIRYLSADEYPSFGFMMKNGATTLWEEWQKPRSMSHPMFGAVVYYLFSHLLGIRRHNETAGFAELDISPYTNEVTGDISGYSELKIGRVCVETDRKNGTYTVSIPDGIKAFCKNANEITEVVGGKHTFSL